MRFRLLETVQMPSEVMVIPISQSLKHSLQIKNSSEISEPKSITWNDAKDHTIPGRSFKVDGIGCMGWMVKRLADG